jgi:hypothetical protein
MDDILLKEQLANSGFSHLVENVIFFNADDAIKGLLFKEVNEAEANQDAAGLNEKMRTAERLSSRLGLLTICILVTKSGFLIVEKSICVDPSDFDEMEGQQYALESALERLIDFSAYQAMADAHRGIHA